MFEQIDKALAFVLGAIKFPVIQKSGLARFERPYEIPEFAIQEAIVNAITYYNLGNPLEETAKLVNRRFKVKISKSSVHGWVKEYKDICTYCEMREKVLKDYGKEILVSKNFEHNGLNYNFKYHKPKLDIFAKNLVCLVKYIEGFESGCPNFFKEDERCSQLRINIKIKKENKYGSVCKLAEIALKAARTNKERHSLVERFMLINDSSTIACEVPVWLWEKGVGFRKIGLRWGLCNTIQIIGLGQGNLEGMWEVKGG